MEDTIIPNLSKLKFDSYIDSFGLANSDPPQNDVDQVIPVMPDIEQNSRFVLFRTRGPLNDVVRSSLNENVEPVPLPQPVPSQVHDPSPPPPKEDIHISNLQKMCD